MGEDYGDIGVKLKELPQMKNLKIYHELIRNVNPLVKYYLNINT